MANKLAIVGSNPMTRENAPWDNPEYDIWVFNEAAQYSWAKRVTGVLQIHKRVRYRRTMNTAHSEHWKWLQEPHDFPIWMQEVDELVPASTEYPLAEIADYLHCEPSFFTSTMAYSIALGLYFQYSTIELYGVEVASSTEYQWQRDNLAYWVGFAQAWQNTHRGTFTRKCANPVFHRPLYGYEGGVYHEPGEFMLRMEQLRAFEMDAIETKAKADQALEGAYADVDNLPIAIEAALMANIELGKVRGKIYETARYLQMVEDMYQVDGMAKLDRAYFDITAGQARQEAEAQTFEVHRVAGRMDYVFMAWHQTHSPTAVAQIRQFTQEHLDAGYQSGYQQGREAENVSLSQQYDDRLKAGGEMEAALDMLTQADA